MPVPDRLGEINELCQEIGIGFESFLKECVDHLHRRLWDLAMPNSEWFKEGYDLNRYWLYLEHVTGHTWDHAKVCQFYGCARQRVKDREQPNPALRYAVMERDNFTCQCCGRHAPGVELEVDHKHPWALGGPTVLENLHALCAECNAGKSARITRDDSQGGVGNDQE